MSDARALLAAELEKIDYLNRAKDVRDGNHTEVSSLLALRAITAAIQQEREECAMVADRNWGKTGAYVAKAIRARNERKDDSDG